MPGATSPKVGLQEFLIFKDKTSRQTTHVSKPINIQKSWPQTLFLLGAGETMGSLLPPAVHLETPCLAVLLDSDPRSLMAKYLPFQTAHPKREGR